MRLPIDEKYATAYGNAAGPAATKAALQPMKPPRLASPVANATMHAVDGPVAVVAEYSFCGRQKAPTVATNCRLPSFARYAAA